MGLRERNAAHTRELITTSALSLFTSRGYDGTTMEDIAELAEISLSTLYRYFPSKDQLVIEPFALRGQMSTELRNRPPGEPLALALGHAVIALLTTPRPGAERLGHLTTVLEGTPSLRARALEIYEHERLLLVDSIAERTGRAHDDPFCVVTSRLTMTILELVAAHGAGSTAPDNVTAVKETVEFVRDLLAQLQLDPPVIPRLDPA